MANVWQCALCEATSKGTAVKRSAGPDRGICTWCASELARLHKECCRHCNGVFAPGEMRTGRGRWCRVCDRAARRERYNRVKDALPAVRRARRAENYEAIRAQERAYEAAKRDERRARNRAYYRKHRAARLAAARAYHAAHAETIRARKAAHYQANPQRFIEGWRMRYMRHKLAILRGLR